MKIIMTLLLVLSFNLYSHPTSLDFHEMGQEKHQVVLIKPVYDYNFSNEISSFGLEFGFWNQARNMNHTSDFFGGDLGLFVNTDDGFTFYIEAQVGVQFGGLSIGPFIDVEKEKNIYGIQYTLWANFILGTYFRLKHDMSFDNLTFSMGLYLAFPIMK